MNGKTERVCVDLEGCGVDRVEIEDCGVAEREVAGVFWGWWVLVGLIFFGILILWRLWKFFRAGVKCRFFA